MSQSNQPDWPSPTVAWYAVAVLVVAFIFSFIDRIIISMLVEPIKADLGLSDTAMGLLQGLAFAVFYAAVGLPIGRLADRYSRRWIIAVGIFLWSLTTAACGLARNFWQLFLARVGVGVGEAALSPSAYSMISDLFPREKLGRALGVYQSGAFFGAGIAFLVGGLVINAVASQPDLTLPLVGQVRAWQVVFFIVGLPGVLVALLMLTVKEPVRRGLQSGGEGISIPEVFRFIGQNRRVYICHFVGFALLATPITVVATWGHPYMVRILGYSLPQAGFILGLILLILSPAGIYAGGWLTDTLTRKGYSDATIRVGLMAGCILLPMSVIATAGTDPRIGVMLFCPWVFCASLSMAVAPAALQVVTPNEMRAQISAAWMLFLNIITAGLGPTAVGLVTDLVFRDEQALGWSMSLLNGIAVPLGALVLWLGQKQFRAAAERQAA